MPSRRHINASYQAQLDSSLYEIDASGTAPHITTNPTSQSVASGNTVTFTVAATGNPTPTVQWQLSENAGSTWGNLVGATSTTYSFTADPSHNGDEYRAVFTNSQGSIDTTAATLTVTSALTSPQVTTNPMNQSVASGNTVTFTAAATGNPTPTVQWQLSENAGSTWGNLVGATSTTPTASPPIRATTGMNTVPCSPIPRVRSTPPLQL